jgi:hypothetical protein
VNFWHFGPFARLTFRVSRASRRRKLAQFYSTCHPGPHDRLLDIGVAPGAGWSTNFGCRAVENFLEENYPWPTQITGLSIDPLSGFPQTHPGMSAVQADACKLPFPDDSFDIVFSNAVIEHVGDTPRQRLFVEECVRVSRRCTFLTAPNRLFPYDVHLAVPGAHYLPRSIWSRLTTDRFLHLLYPWQLRRLLPAAWTPRRLSPLWSPSIAVILTRPASGDAAHG